jgi:septal ring factor EnvC (AmiA/AmiB activator)
MSAEEPQPPPSTRPSTSRPQKRNSEWKDGKFGYFSPAPPPQLTPEQRRALRGKSFQQRLSEINEKFQSEDQKLESLRYQYTKLCKETESIKQRIVDEATEAEKACKDLKDPEKATKDALATSHRTLRLIERLRSQEKPRMYIDRRPTILSESQSARRGTRYQPKRGYVPPEEAQD